MRYSLLFALSLAPLLTACVTEPPRGDYYAPGPASRHRVDDDARYTPDREGYDERMENHDCGYDRHC